MALRRLGVYAESNPTKKAKSVAAADFSIAGLLGFFERKFDKAFPVNSPEEAVRIFGLQGISSQYGWDAVNGFFANTAGVQATLYIVSHVGNTAGAIDAVVASADLDDQQSTPEQVLTLEAAYQEELEYGISGNRIGYQIELGDRFTTAAFGAGTASDTFAILDSVADIKVGDLVTFSLTGVAPVTVTKKITAIDEGTNTVTFAGVIHATSNLADNDVVTVPAFKIKCYRKTTSGLVTEVERVTGQMWLSTEIEVSAYYAPNVLATHQWLKVTRNSTTPTDITETLPAAVSTTAYLASGADGTAPTTEAHWALELARLDNLPVRMMGNCESTDEAIQKAIETYCRDRDDMPKVIFNIAEDRTKAQLEAIGHLYQRSDDVLGVIVANWLKVTDPFNTSPLAPDRNVPNVGHVMGLWIRSIGTRGLHYVPATKDMPIYGVNGIVGDQFLDDYDRTEIANAGVNLIQYITGSGTIVRNFFTPSTSAEFLPANGIMMREFLKVSAVDSLQLSENTPNSLDRIQEDRMAILNFLYRLWAVGSTGNAPRGEFFGQSFREDGTPTRPTDHFEVKADIINNPLTSIEAGNRNLDVWFTFPAPAGSIRIGVGILLRG